MKTRFIFIFTLFLVCPVFLYCQQHVKFSVNGGIGTYAMGDLSELNKDLLNGIPVRAKIVDNFPPYPYFKVTGQYERRKLAVGLAYVHYSTGSRIHYADYSGEISIRQLIKTNGVGLPLSLKLTEKEKLNWFFHLEPGSLNTHVLLKEHIEVYTEYADEGYEFTSTSLYLQTGFSCTYTFGSLGIGADVGLIIDTGGALYLNGNKNLKLTDYKDNPIRSNLTGLRAGFSISYIIDISRSRL